jgi:hypothetical protein
MSTLDYTVEPEVECPYSDVNDAAFIWAMATIGGRDAVDEFLACGVYPLASGFGFRDVDIGTTVMSKVETPLPILPMKVISLKAADRFLA